MNTPAAPAAGNRIVPDEFDPSDFANIEPLIEALLRREPASPDELREWVLDFSELLAHVWEYGTHCDVDNACDTEDEDVEARLLHWLRDINPAMQPMIFKLQQKYIASAHHDSLGDTDASYAVMNRQWQADVGLFREENVALDTQVAELDKDYGKTQGAMTVEFDGQTQTMQQIAKVQEETDRDRREAAWRASMERRLQDRDAIDGLYDKQIALRQQISQNAGHDNFRDYIWVKKYRFDYTPDDCHAYADAIETHCVPLLRKLGEQRKAALGVDALRPWDTAVDPHGRDPLRPFDPDEIDDFVETTARTFDRVTPEFGDQLRSLAMHGDLDLASRKGKRPGGFQAVFDASKRPFIFMNAVGTQRDLETLLHEGGHAFHSLAYGAIDNLFVRDSPIEFCEVASMSMELLTCDAFDLFYDDPADAARAKRHQLEGVLANLAGIAIIDQFQHWVYTHPQHTRAERTAAWVTLNERFGGGVDWTDLEPFREIHWQRVPHLFGVPFYYIEYGIAQLGSLGVWLNYQRDKASALANLRAALALGGSRPLPTLYETAGVPFRFDAETVQPLVAMIDKELAALSD